MAMLAHAMNATVHAPGEGSTAKGLDRLRSRIAGPEAMWTLARKVARQVGPNDVVFCGSEAGGLHMAEACGSGPGRPHLSVFVHNLDRPRGRLALKAFGFKRRVELMWACSSHQTDFLRRYLGVPDSRARFIWDHTDTGFFTPGPMSTGKRRPLIVSVGLEQRDYRTLADATKDLDVDVKISGFSEDAAVLQRTFPDTLPANMSRKFYSWPDLVQLYRDADLVVVSVHENQYAAGVQSLMEAMACGRPVVATASAGLTSYLDESAVMRVPPANPDAMRQAIAEALADAASSERRAARGLVLAQERHRIERYVDEIAEHLRALG